MVLLNGVKYACERCIRGHRVSSCTHTDKPLTMIKPKGRPASQCSHCRESRKIKNTHSSCSCGKKGKSPGQHLASCLCHKNSHCTCPTKEKKEIKSRIKPVEHPHLVGKTMEEGSTEGLIKSKDEQDIIIEDVWIPFDQGLLDFFQDGGNENRPQQEGHYANQSMSNDREEIKDPASYSLDQMPNPPSDADLDFMENMFPLFPLVGTQSFDDSRSLPLSPIPNPGTQQCGLEEVGLGPHSSRLHDHPRQQDEGSDAQQLFGRAEQAQLMHGPYNVGPASSASSSTHNPRPLRASSSFSSGALHTVAKPKRPESVLSIASSSSNASKLENSGNFSHGPLKVASSTAFPPFINPDVGSCDDLSKNYFEGTHTSNEAHPHSLASDQEDFTNNIRAFSVGTTPQSSLPSRQPSVSRRKTSLSRSQSQLHQNHSSMLKESPLVPLKSADSGGDVNFRANDNSFSSMGDNNGQGEKGEDSWQHSINAAYVSDNNIALSSQQAGTFL